MKNNKMYLIGKTNHSILSILLVEQKDIFPLTSELHNRLLRLTEESDVILAFGRGLEEELDLEKITNLYGCTGYVVSDKSCNLAELLVWTSLYAKELLPGYFSYLTGTLEGLGEILGDYDKFMNNLVKVHISGLISVVAEIDRLESRELYEFYKPIKKKIFSITNLIKTGNPWKEVLVTGKDNINSRYKTKIPLVFLRLNHVKVLTDNYENKNFQDYLDTFVSPDISYFLGSYIMYSGVKLLNNGLWNLEIGEI